MKKTLCIVLVILAILANPIFANEDDHSNGIVTIEPRAAVIQVNKKVPVDVPEDYAGISGLGFTITGTYQLANGRPTNINLNTVPYNRDLQIVSQRYTVVSINKIKATITYDILGIVLTPQTVVVMIN